MEKLASHPDSIEVSREAHQLAKTHGLYAQIYAQRLATKASDNGNQKEAEFWQAVYTALRPRGDS